MASEEISSPPTLPLNRSETMLVQTEAGAKPMAGNDAKGIIESSVVEVQPSRPTSQLSPKALSHVDDDDDDGDGIEKPSQPFSNLKWDPVNKPWSPIRGRQMHWVSRKVMICCFLIAFALMLGHHFWYHSLVNHNIGDNFEQQRTRLFGNVFPLMVQVFLAISIKIAFIQYLFLCLRYRPVTVKCLDAAYEATASLLFLLNWEMIKTLPEVSLLAILIGLLTIPTTMVTPGTLLVSQSMVSNGVMMNISQLSISSVQDKQTGFFYVSRPAYGVNSLDNSSVIFLGPRTIVSRLSVATGAEGEILRLSAPAVNSSYSVQFFGPYVQCEEANSTISEIIDSVILSQSKDENSTTLEVYNAYYAYVPDLVTAGQLGMPNSRDVNSSQSSNQLWMSYKQNGTGWDESDYPKCPLTTYRVCQLYNATYDLQVAFENGNMSVTYPAPQILNAVDYPAGVVNASLPDTRIQMAYSAYFWALTDLLTGNMGLYFENIVQSGTTYNTNFTAILTNIQNTALLGSADLDCFFALDWMYQGVSWRPPTLQRELDVELAENRTLNVSIAELSANFTISMMINPLLAPAVQSNVNVTTAVEVYKYHASTLLISYGVTFLAVLAANLLGLYAFHRNEVVMDMSFFSTASATQHTHLLDEAHYIHRGSVPVPKVVRQQRMLFKKLDGGGWGFIIESSEPEEDEKTLD